MSDTIGLFIFAIIVLAICFVNMGKADKRGDERASNIYFIIGAGAALVIFIIILVQIIKIAWEG